MLPRQILSLTWTCLWKFCYIMQQCEWGFLSRTVSVLACSNQHLATQVCLIGGQLAISWLTPGTTGMCQNTRSLLPRHMDHNVWEMLELNSVDAQKPSTRPITREVSPVKSGCQARSGCGAWDLHPLVELLEQCMSHLNSKAILVPHHISPNSFSFLLTGMQKCHELCGLIESSFELSRSPEGHTGI